MKYKFSSYIIVSVIIISMILGNTALAAHKKAAVKKQTPEQITDPYKKAELDLDRRFYQAYRIVDRLARANKLDNYSWRIVIPVNEEDYELNASATSSNAIILKPGLVDSFSGEVSALATVIAHEMAHNIHKDLARQQRLQDQFKRKLEDLGVILINKESEQHLSPVDIILEYIVSAIAKEELEEKKIKIKELESDLLAEIRRHEYEADQAALVYLTRAGFKPKEAMRFFELIKRQNGYVDQETLTHPRPENRIWQLENQLKTMNIQQLKNEGQRIISATKPLNYQKFFNKQEIGKPKYVVAIVIHSKYGSHNDINKPFRELFGR